MQLLISMRITSGARINKENGGKCNAIYMRRLFSSSTRFNGHLSAIFARLQAYLESFFNFCKELGGATAEIMCEILAFEVRRVEVKLPQGFVA